MKLVNKVAILATVFTASLSVIAEEKSELRVVTTEVAPKLYMLEGAGGFVGGNMMLSIGEDGVVLIDDALSSNLSLLKTAIKSVTDQPIDYLINTHFHADHIGNNEAFSKEGSHIVAHENIRHRLLKGAASSDNKKVVKGSLPVITFSHAMDFHLNGDDMHIFHVKNAHTDGDAVIHIENENIIHTGDTMFNGMFPYIDLANGGSLDGYINAQKTILALSDEQTKIIPGHGPIANKQDLQASIDMLEDTKQIITKLIASGKSEDEIVKLNPLSIYHDKWNWGFITTERMTRQIVQGLH
ncbi:MAG: MBL fold metallo-hydrolase [Colwellia sp.]|nr:MBL fold metallo-hydrolase [Colwellia sp.]